MTAAAVNHPALMNSVNVGAAMRAADTLREWVSLAYPDSAEERRRSLRISSVTPPYCPDVDMSDYATDILDALDTIVDAAQREAHRTRGIRPSVRHLRTPR